MEFKPHFKEETARLYNEGKLSDVHSVPSSRKEILMKMQYVYGLYCSNALLFGYGGVTNGRSIRELRAYSSGEQSIDRYKKIVDRRIKNGGDPNAPEKSMLNISWDNVMVLPKYVEQALTKIIIEFDPSVVAMDNASNYERQMAIARDKLKSDPRMQALYNKTGMKPEYESSIAESIDVDFAARMGAYQLAVEAQTEGIISATIDSSSYETIAEMHRRDIIDANCFAADCEFDSEGKIVGIEYVDIEGLIVPISKYPDYRDIPYAGYISEVKISDIQHEMKEAGYTESQVAGMARKYGNYRPNTRMAANKSYILGDAGSREAFAAKNSYNIYDPFTVCVMTLKWKCYDEESGSQRVWKAKWVIGTDIIYCDEMEFAHGYEKINGKTEALLPIVVYAIDGPSLVERCVSHVDDLQEAVLRLRATRSKLPPGQMIAIDMRLLSNVTDLGDGKEYNMLEILDIFEGTGKLFYESISPMESGDSSGRKPIDNINIGVSEMFNQYAAQINSSLEMIRQVTGMNEVADGTANPNDLLVGTMDGLQESSNNVLATFSRAMNRHSSRLFSVIARKYQMAVAYGDIQLTSISMASAGLFAVTLTKDVMFRDIVVTAKPRPNPKEIETTFQLAISKMQTGELTTADLMIIQDFLRQKNYKSAQLYMARAIETNQKRMAAEKNQLMAVQAQEQTKMVQAQEQAKMQTGAMTLEGQMKMEQLKHVNKMEQIKLEASLTVPQTF